MTTNGGAELRGVILAGGTGSRLFPLTKVTNKHLLPVGHEPMIFHPVRKLVEAKIREILIVTGTEHMGDVVGLLGSGTDFGCEFTYRVQDQAGGIAQALGLAQRFGRGGRLAVILGDNIFSGSIAGFADAFRAQKSGAKILVKEVPDTGRYGVAVTEAGRVVRILEKPKDPPSSLAVTGIYFYDESVFQVIAGLKPSARGELEITDVNNAYIARGDLTFDTLPGWWTDAGTFESLKLANELASTSGYASRTVPTPFEHVGHVRRSRHAGERPLFRRCSRGTFPAQCAPADNEELTDAIVDGNSPQLLCPHRARHGLDPWLRWITNARTEGIGREWRRCCHQHRGSDGSAPGWRTRCFERRRFDGRRRRRRRRPHGRRWDGRLEHGNRRRGNR